MLGLSFFVKEETMKEDNIIFTFEIDGMQMPFRCDYKTDGNYWKAVYKWNRLIKEAENSRHV